MRIHRPTHTTVVAYLALFFAMGGTAVAASGSTFVTGRSNAATTVTTLTNSRGTALVLRSKAGIPSLKVSSSSKVAALNADRLDSLDSSQLQRRISGSCPVGQSVRVVGASGAVACQAQEVLQEQDVIDATAGGEYEGFGAATCPTGYAVVGGGFATGTDPNTAPAPALVQAAAAASFDDPDTGKRVDVYYVELTNPDGTPYAGGGAVVAQCVRGTSRDDTTAAAQGLKRAAAPAAGSAMARYLHE